MPRVEDSVEQLVHFAEKGDLQQVKELVESERVSVDAPNSRRECAIHAAVRRGRTECVRYLLMQNAAVDITDADGNWPIHLAARAVVNAKARPEIVGLLLRKKRHHVNVLNPQRESPLHLAANWADIDTVRVLLDYNADATLPGYNGLTALHIACMRGKVDIAAELLGCGAKISAIDETGKTALHQAAFCPNARMTTFLIDRGANVDALDQIGATAVHWACASGHTDVLRALLQAGAEPNLKTNKGNTPLHLAAKEGYAACVSLMLEIGVYSDILNHAREAPIDLAHRFRHPDVVQLLTSNPNPSPLNQSQSQATADRMRYAELAHKTVIENTRSLALDSSTHQPEPSVMMMSKADVVMSTKSSITIPDVSLPDYFIESIEKYRDKVALVDLSSGYQLTYRQLSVGIRRVAAGLYEQGLDYRQTVSLLAPNIPETVVILHAIGYLGATLSPVNPSWTTQQVAYHLGHSGASVVITTVELLKKAFDACDIVQSVSKVFVIGSEGPFDNDNVVPFSVLCQPGKLFPDIPLQFRKDIVLAPFTNGKTENPKCVEFTHYNLVAQLAQGATYEDISETDVIFAAIPFHHVIGLIYQTHIPLMKGATLLLSPDASVSALHSAIEDRCVTRLFLIPPVLRGLLYNPESKRRRLTSIKQIYCGGSELPVDLAAETSRFFRCYIRQLYGSSETGVALSDVGGYNTIPVTSVGQLLPNMECKIVNRDGQLLKADQHGEICLRGPQIFMGYKDDRSTHRLDAHGWFRTGDVGYFDSQGYFYFVGTQKDIAQKRNRPLVEPTPQAKPPKEPAEKPPTVQKAPPKPATKAKPKQELDPIPEQKPRPEPIQKPINTSSTVASQPKKPIPKTKSPYSLAQDDDEYSEDDDDFNKPLEIKKPVNQQTQHITAPPSKPPPVVTNLETKPVVVAAPIVTSPQNVYQVDPIPIKAPEPVMVNLPAHAPHAFDHDDEIPPNMVQPVQRDVQLKIPANPTFGGKEERQNPIKQMSKSGTVIPAVEETISQHNPSQPPSARSLHPPSTHESNHETNNVEEAQTGASPQTTIHALFDLTVFHCPNEQAIRYENRRLTFSMLSERTNKLANAFVRIGLKKSQKVVIIAKNSDYYIETIFAAAKTGLVLVPINNMYPPDDIKLIIQNCDAAAILVGEEYIQNIVKIKDEIPFVKHIIVVEGNPPPRMLSYEEMIKVSSPEFNPQPTTDDDLAWQLYTSGTTGIPKGCMFSHGGIVGALQSFVQDVNIAPYEVAMVVCNLFNPSNLMFAIMALIQGGSIVVLREFVPQKVISTLSEGSVQHVFLMPPMIQYMAKMPGLETQQFSSVKNIVYTSSSLPIDILRKTKKIFPQSGFVQTFGQVETCGLISLLRSQDHNLDSSDARRVLKSCGSAAFNYQVRVIDDNGHDVEPGDIGELIVYGPGIMKGYFKKPNETAQALRGGWLYTGDVGTMNEDGKIFIIDRKCDVVKINGASIYPREIEEFLFSNRGVSDVAVAGHYDLKQGQVLKAYVVVNNPKLTPEEIISFCAQNLPPNKVPKAAQIVTSLPKNASGKVMKRLLAQAALAQASSAQTQAKK